MIVDFLEWELFILKASTVIILLMIAVSLVLLPLSFFFYNEVVPSLGRLILLFLGGWVGLFGLGTLINLVSIFVKKVLSILSK